MKSLSLVGIISFCLSFTSLAQLLTTYNGTYKWKDKTVTMTQVSYDGTNITPATPVARTAFSLEDQEFIIFGDDGTNVFLKVLNYAYYVGNISAVHYEVTQNFYIFNFDGNPDQYDALPNWDKNARYYHPYQMYFKVPIATFQAESTPINHVPSFCQTSVKASNPVKLGYEKVGKYKWKDEIFMSECTTDGKVLPRKNKIRSKSGQLFRVLGSRNDSLVIIIYNYVYKDKKVKDVYTPSSSFFTYNFSGDTDDYDNKLAQEERDGMNYGSYQKYFVIDKNALDSFAVSNEKIGASLDVGTLTLPFRMRFDGKGSTDFSTDLNLSTAVGLGIARYERRSFSFSILGAFGLTNVNLDTVSVVRNKEMLESTNSFNSLSLALGGMVEYKNFQAGLFIGTDGLSALNNSTFGWTYQWKPWLGVGVGYSIFSTKEKEPSAKKDIQKNL